MGYPFVQNGRQNPQRSGGTWNAKVAIWTGEVGGTKLVPTIVYIETNYGLAGSRAVLLCNV